MRPRLHNAPTGRTASDYYAINSREGLSAVPRPTTRLSSKPARGRTNLTDQNQRGRSCDIAAVRRQPSACQGSRAFRLAAEARRVRATARGHPVGRRDRHSPRHPAALRHWPRRRPGWAPWESRSWLDRPQVGKRTCSIISILGLIARAARRCAREYADASPHQLLPALLVGAGGRGGQYDMIRMIAVAILRSSEDRMAARTRARLRPSPPSTSSSSEGLGSGIEAGVAAMPQGIVTLQVRRAHAVRSRGSDAFAHRADPKAAPMIGPNCWKTSTTCEPADQGPETRRGKSSTA